MTFIVPSGNRKLIVTWSRPPCRDEIWPEMDSLDCGDPALAKEIAYRWNYFHDTQLWKYSKPISLWRRLLWAWRQWRADRRRAR